VRSGKPAIRTFKTDRAGIEIEAQDLALPAPGRYARAPEAAPHVWPNTLSLEDHMNDFTHDTADVAPRRSFFTRAAGAIALGLAGFAPSRLRAQAA
jgi:hypothetical protein